MTLRADFLRENARRDASELIDDILLKALHERRFGRVEVVYQDGVPTLVREERIHKIGERDGPWAAA